MSKRSEVLAAFQETALELTGLLDRLNEETLNRKSDATAWSPGQIGDHVLKSYASVHTMAGKTSPTKRKPDELIGHIKTLFLDFGIRMDSPKAILPGNGPFDKSSLVMQLHERIEQLLAVIRTKDLSETCLDFAIPEYGPFTRLEWAWFNTYHTMRHVHQLKEVMGIA